MCCVSHTRAVESVTGIVNPQCFHHTIDKVHKRVYLLIYIYIEKAVEKCRSIGGTMFDTHLMDVVQFVDVKCRNKELFEKV